METKLIYVNKGNSIVRNEATGDFVSEVPSVEVKAGDSISVESLAISTDGTGADTIEIPQVVRNYNYKTNEVQLEFMVYIHANFRYTCQLPLTGQNIYTTLNALNYGDLDPSVFVTSSNTDYTPKNPAIVEKWAGSRFYIGTFGNDGDDPIIPYKSTTPDNPNGSTGNLVYNFLTTKIPCKLDYGYNTPENITSKVTFDLHNSGFTPNNTIWTDQRNYYVRNTDNLDLIPQATCVSKNSSVITIFGLPQQYFNSSTAPDTQYFPTYSNFICTHDPFYWYYGTRLKAQSPNGTTKNNTYATIALGASNITQSDIIIYNPLRQTAPPNPATTIQAGDVVVTNLPYNNATILKLQKFLFSQKYYTYGGGRTREKMKTDLGSWDVRILFGMYDDSTSTPHLSSSPLTDKVNGAANSIKPCYATTKAFYNEDLFNAANIPIATPTYPITISNRFHTLPNGKSVTPKELAKYYNINIIPCVTDPADTYFSIGIILQENTLLGLNNDVTILPGSFCLFDSSMSREEAVSQVIASSDLINGDTAGKHNLDKMVRGFNVGAPNIQLIFNSDRSRFGFSNMYWSSYIGNEDGATDANPSADVEAISCNRINTAYYRPLNNQVIYTQYAQSGLGLSNIYVKDGNDNWNVIDYNDPNDVKLKYTNSILERIGFDIGDLFDDYGIPYVFYQERYSFNNEPIPYPQLFPFPLTCTPEVDTAFNISINANSNNLPMFTLSLERNVTGINVAVQSAQVLARNKPKKLATPFWLIESDILPATKYYVDGMPHNIMAICNRAYGSGDFVFSFASDYKFIATKSFVISCIKTNILTSELLPALVDNSTTIVYKIESPIMPNFVSAQQALELEAEQEQKVKGK